MLEHRIFKIEYLNISGLFSKCVGDLYHLLKFKTPLKFNIFFSLIGYKPLHTTPFKLKFLIGSVNQQVTKALSKQVGTSETLRPLTKFNLRKLSFQIYFLNRYCIFFKMHQIKQQIKKFQIMSTSKNNQSLSNLTNLVEESWNEYLAGLIDGDGYLGISNKGFASLEITMDIHDEYALNKVKQKLGGSVKLRSGARAFRYRLHHKEGIINLLHRINGYIRNSKRIPQLQKMCSLYEIPYKDPVKITRENSWFAGFFDADGTIDYSVKKGWPQLTISVSNKKEIDLMPFQEVFGGFIRLDKASNTYKWDIYSTEAINDFYEYLQKHPLNSHKKQRIFLVKRFFELRGYRAYKEESNSLLFKAWIQFEKDWNTFY